MEIQKPLSAKKMGDLLLIVSLVVCGFFIWKLPGWIFTSSTQTQIHAINEVRMTMTIVFIGLMLTGGLILLLRRLAWIEKYFAATKESLLTDRFSKAVEQLGTYKLEVQIGGIFTLERIAQESEQNHWIIMEVLTAYVRENAQWNPSLIHAKGEVDEIKEPAKYSKGATDIQAVMTVIGRRSWTDQELLQGKILNLRKTNLEYVDLRGANLRFANLRGVNLEGANLMDADLTGAFLGEANLKNANLSKTNLTETMFIGADLSGTNLKGSVIESTSFAKANLKGAQLVEAVITSANFTSANLEEANLGGVALNQANLTNTRLKHLKYDYGTNFPDWLTEDKRDELSMEFRPV